jgi:hypothetical protein
MKLEQRTFQPIFAPMGRIRHTTITVARCDRADMRNIEVNVSEANRIDTTCAYRSEGQPSTMAGRGKIYVRE